MTAEIVAAAVEELIAKLDPERDYGERSYVRVVEQVRAGELILLPGETLPIIQDAVTRRAVAGTGRPPSNGAPIQATALAEFRRRAWGNGDFDTAYKLLIEGLHDKKAGHHYQKLFWEMFVGKVPESRDAGVPEMMAKLLEAATITREVVIEPKSA